VISPLLKKIKIPSVIAMIFMGCIARNFFGKPVEAYNNEWAQ
jgi:Kef-type K+ transport system membrane component KefB